MGMRLNMIQPYQGHCEYSEGMIDLLDPDEIGVYYCGYKTPDNRLIPLYIGKGISDTGIRGSLLEHLKNENWPDVTHFGYQACDTVRESEALEKTEINEYKPTYNTQGNK